MLDNLHIHRYRTLGVFLRKIALTYVRLKTELWT